MFHDFQTTRFKHKILKNVSIKFEKKYSLRPGAIIESGDKYLYRKLGMHFHIDKTLTKEEGRKLLFILINDFLNEINNQKDFKKYMCKYPFSEENIEIALFAMGEDGAGSFYPNILVFGLSNEKIRYCVSLKDGLGFYSVEEESYEEAKRIVESQN